MNFNRPNKMVDILKDAAVDKAGKTKRQLVLLAFLGGAYIALGSMFAVIVTGGLTNISATNPGLVKLMFGLTFPLGFVLVTLAGAELFTSTTAIMTVGVYYKGVSIKDLFRVWAFSYFINFVGALFVVYVIAKFSGVFSSEAYTNAILNIAHHKLESGFFTTFIKGIGANWLVCLAAFLTYSAKDAASKIVALWAPVTAFVALGFEHSIANMFFIPMAKVLGADISWGEFFSVNLIPVTLGNIVGGVVFVGLFYSVIYSGKTRGNR